MVRVHLFVLITFILTLNLHGSLENEVSLARPINYEEIGGDIKVPIVTRGVAMRGNYVRWPNGTVPYEISSQYTTAERNAIISAMRTMESLTAVNNVPCVTFRERVATDNSYYIYIYSGSGCSSYVGRYTGFTFNRTVSLQRPGCIYSGIIMHELIHVLGFYHEQSRPDRNTYIQINWDTIQTGYENNFNIYTDTEVNTLNTSYDYGSVMHYERDAFTKNGSDTIKPLLNATAVIGQRITMSPIDIEEVRLFYGCYGTGTTSTSTTRSTTTPTTTTRSTTTSTTTTRSTTIATTTSSTGRSTTTATTTPSTTRSTTNPTTTTRSTTIAATTERSTTITASTTRSTTITNNTARSTTIPVTTARSVTTTTTTAKSTTTISSSTITTNSSGTRTTTHSSTKTTTDSSNTSITDRNNIITTDAGITATTSARSSTPVTTSITNMRLNTTNSTTSSPSTTTTRRTSISTTNPKSNKTTSPPYCIVTITLTVNNSKYQRINGSSSTYYYITTQITISTSSNYTFRSVSTFSMYCFLYINSFNPRNPSMNLIAQGRNSGGTGMFQFTTFLSVGGTRTKRKRAAETYVLVSTTEDPDVIGDATTTISGASEESVVTIITSDNATIISSDTNDDDDDDDSGKIAGIIAGSVIGGILLLICLCALCLGVIFSWFYCMKGKPLRSNGIFVHTGFGNQNEIGNTIFQPNSFDGFSFKDDKWHGQENLTLAFYPQADHTVYGKGTDHLGTFVATGVYSPRTLRIAFDKRYQTGVGHTPPNPVQITTVQLAWNSSTQAFEGKSYSRGANHREEQRYIIRKANARYRRYP